MKVTGTRALKHVLLVGLAALPAAAFMGGCTAAEVGDYDEEEATLGTTQEAVTLVTLWEDNFDGSTLNRGNWNVQTSLDEHACTAVTPPAVPQRFNGEAQSYVDRENC